MTDNLNKYLRHLAQIGLEDVNGLQEAHKSYGASCLKRGGAGLFMMFARKWDRLEKLLESGVVKTGETFSQWDIFAALQLDPRAEGVIDDIRDLRRYLMIAEAHARALGISSAQSKHRDNQPEDGIVGFPGQCVVLDGLGTEAKDVISSSLAPSETILGHVTGGTVPALASYQDFFSEKLGIEVSTFQLLEKAVSECETFATACDKLHLTLGVGGKLIEDYMALVDEMPPLLNGHGAPVARIHQKLAYFSTEKPKAQPKVAEPRGFDPEQDIAVAKADAAVLKADPAIS